MIRVFPRRTKWTPADELAFIGEPALFRPPDNMPVYISCTFTWDKPIAEKLYKSWKQYYSDVRLGGVAYDDKGEDFVSGRFIKQGVTITSRGCNNKCWYCYVWRREGNLRELPIVDGYIIQDNNLLACSDKHINAVFDMLKRQKERAIFAGGLDARLLKKWHAERLAEIRAKQIFVSYDNRDELDAIYEAGELLNSYGLNRDKRITMCYVLIGFPKDTFEDAEKRLKDVCRAGWLPFAMLYRDDKGLYDKTWRQFQRIWARPAATMAIINNEHLVAV